LLPTPQQQVDLFIATYQRGQIPLAQRLEAALGGTRADHLPCRSRRGQALQCEMPDLTIVKKAAHEIARACANQYGVRLCSGLELRCEVRGLADRDGCKDGVAGTRAAYHNEP
jgi:hypothetical protein